MRRSDAGRLAPHGETREPMRGTALQPRIEVLLGFVCQQYASGQLDHGPVAVTVPRLVVCAEGSGEPRGRVAIQTF